jgi:DNA-binding transcriptional MocR family regulator
MTSKSAWMTAWAADGRPGSSPPRAVVALAVWGSARADGTHALVGIDWLVTITGVSRSTIQRTLRELRAEGWIVVHERGHNRGGKAKATLTIYDLATPAQCVTHVDALSPDEAQQVTQDDALRTGLNASNTGAQCVTQDDAYPTPNGVARAHARAREAPESNGSWPFAQSTAPPPDVAALLDQFRTKQPTRKGKRST